DTVCRHCKDGRRREPFRQRAGRLEAIDRVELVVLFDRKVECVPVVRKWTERGSKAGANNCLVVESVGNSEARGGICLLLMNADVLRYVPITGHTQCVVGWVVVRETTLVNQPDKWRVVLVAQTQIDCQFLRHLPFVVNEKEVRPVLRSRIIEHDYIASDAPWQVEEERGEGVAHAHLR